MSNQHLILALLLSGGQNKEERKVLVLFVVYVFILFLVRIWLYEGAVVDDLTWMSLVWSTFKCWTTHVLLFMSKNMGYLLRPNKGFLSEMYKPRCTPYKSAMHRASWHPLMGLPNGILESHHVWWYLPIALVLFTTVLSIIYNR